MYAQTIFLSMISYKHAWLRQSNELEILKTIPP